MGITDKMTPICKVSDIVDRSKVKGDLFVASDKDGTTEALVYANDGFNNSDRVRSHYGKQTGIKFNTVRCCRLKNYKG